MDDEEIFDEEDDAICTRCGGPLYTQPHWNYSQCDDCGWREQKEGEYD